MDADLVRFGFADLAGRWPSFPQEADKYARGVVGLVTGSAKYPGAAVLSVVGAVNAGAGFVRFLGAGAAFAAILARTPSVTFGAGRVDALVAGCGWDDEDRSGNKQLWENIMQVNCPVVVDAGAIALARTGCPSQSLLTPHAGELARLLGVARSVVDQDPAGLAIRAAHQLQAVVLLKGHNQYVATPEGRVTAIEAGASWTARAGSGDVLAGIAGTILAQTSDPETAALLAAGIQAWVATQQPGPYPPDRLAEFLPQYIGMLSQDLR